MEHRELLRNHRSLKMEYEQFKHEAGERSLKAESAAREALKRRRRPAAAPGVGSGPSITEVVDRECQTQNPVPEARRKAVGMQKAEKSAGDDQLSAPRVEDYPCGTARGVELGSQ